MKSYPCYIVIIISYHKDPYKPTSRMESRKVFFVAQLKPWEFVEVKSLQFRYITPLPGAKTTRKKNTKNNRTQKKTKSWRWRLWPPILEDSEKISCSILSAKILWRANNCETAGWCGSHSTKASHLFSCRTDASALATLQLTACMSGMAGAKTTGPRKGDTVG